MSQTGADIAKMVEDKVGDLAEIAFNRLDEMSIAQMREFEGGMRDLASKHYRYLTRPILGLLCKAMNTVSETINDRLCDARKEVV